MMNAREAKEITQNKIESRRKDAFDLVSKEIENATALGEFSTTVDGDLLREVSVREEIVIKLKELGYKASFISDGNPPCYQIDISW